MPIEAKRTPNENFQNLSGFDYAPNYVDDLAGYEGLRVCLLYTSPSPRDS